MVGDMQYYYACFERDFHKKSGMEFQRWFVLLASHAYGSDFESVRPAGKDGDFKADGRRVSTGTIYQCYAPQSLRTRELKNKISADFNGAREHWKDMREWILVVNTNDGLPARSLQLLDRLRTENPDIEISVWMQAQLSELMRKLDRPALESIFGQPNFKGQDEPEATRDPADGLPPICRARIEGLWSSDPRTWSHIVELLSDPASRQPGVLSRLADDPPPWLLRAGYAAWEAVSDFIDAHDIGDSDKTREKAIDAGSPRSDFYRIRQAMLAAAEEDADRAHELLALADNGHPMLPVAQAYIANDWPAVVQAVNASMLPESEDADLAIYSTLALLDAYSHLNRLESIERPLKAVIDRFPDRSHLLLLVLARSRIRLVQSRPWVEAENRDILHKAVDVALRSRDLIRTWQGPSHHAVEVAVNALFQLKNFQRIVDIATMKPQGEAISSEANSPEVQVKLAEALSMLGCYGEIDNLQLDQIDDPEITLIQAMQAHGLGDPAAISKIRRAVTRAVDSDNESALMKALFYLAQYGEVDESSMQRIPAADADLMRGIAALRREKPSEALHVLTSYRLESPLHAFCLADALNKTGELDEAIETLQEAADHFGAEWLYQSAVEMLVEHDRLEDAECMAADALARNPSRVDRRRLLSRLVEIAQSRQDWGKMESHALAGFNEDPDNPRLAWAVIHARYKQMKLQQAREYLIEHDLEPFDDHTARLAIDLYGSVDDEALPDDTQRILRIAKQYQNSEEVAGEALMTLMARGDRFIDSDKQRQQMGEMLEDYTERHPESATLRPYSFEHPEEFVEMITAAQKTWIERSTPLVNMVRYGQWPYGSLAWSHELPYAKLLLSLTAEELTAIPVDEARREHERDAVRQALGNEVAVDTSVAALGVHTGLEVARMGEAFKRVLIADELVFDARRAVYVTKRGGIGTLTYDPGLGRVIHHEFSDQQRAAAQAEAEQLTETLTRWRSIQSASLPRIQPSSEEDLRPWDSSLSVALSRGCALWCDDLGLRSLAESEGITAFSTWALYEVLTSTDSGSWLPALAEMKMRLLRARIADVPITFHELEQTMVGSDGPDIAIDLLLRRPIVWVNNKAEAPGYGNLRRETISWFLHHLMRTFNGPHRQRIPGLLAAACHGLGVVFGVKASSIMAAYIIMITWRVCASLNDPKLAPTLTADLVKAARYAAGQLDPINRPDPLENIVRHLLILLEENTDTQNVAQVIVWMFSETAPADRRIVTAAVFGDR